MLTARERTPAPSVSSTSSCSRASSGRLLRRVSDRLTSGCACTPPKPLPARTRSAPGPARRPQVHELLQGAAPLLPERPAKRAPHPDLAPRLEQLKAAQANREYAAMLRGVHGSQGGEDREEAEMISYKSQIGVCAPRLPRP